jgi:hypothetical protein
MFYTTYETSVEYECKHTLPVTILVALRVGGMWNALEYLRRLEKQPCTQCRSTCEIENTADCY